MRKWVMNSTPAGSLARLEDATEESSSARAAVARVLLTEARIDVDHLRHVLAHASQSRQQPALEQVRLAMAAETTCRGVNSDERTSTCWQSLAMNASNSNREAGPNLTGWRQKPVRPAAEVHIRDVRDNAASARQLHLSRRHQG